MIEIIMIFYKILNLLDKAKLLKLLEDSELSHLVPFRPIYMNIEKNIDFQIILI